jgi:hypothetical protein
MIFDIEEKIPVGPQCVKTDIELYGTQLCCQNFFELFSEIFHLLCIVCNIDNTDNLLLLCYRSSLYLGKRIIMYLPCMLSIMGSCL